MGGLRKFIRKAIVEAYDDVPLDSIKSQKKLKDYTDFSDIKEIGNNTYLHLHFIEPDDWSLWGSIKVFDNSDGTEIARANYGKRTEWDTMKASIDVRPDKRRLGIASNIYKWVEELTKDELYPDIPHSPSAEKLWTNPNREFGVGKNIREIVSKLIKEDYNLGKRKLRLISESRLENKTIINVDIQPEYKNYITFNLKDWVNFINRSATSNNIIFLYNGQETLGMIDEYSFKDWLFDLGIKENVIENSTFYDKGYAFFRYCMDNSIGEQNIVDLIKYMIRHNVDDSRDINEDMWNDYMKETNHTRSDVRELLENAGDMINIPDLMYFLGDYSNIVLTGGGINECLKEVEIALLSLDKKYNILSQFVY